MTTGFERYSGHEVWETLRLKRESLNAARFDNEASEQAREDIIEWLDEALKTRAARQPSLYLGALDQLSAALNQLPVDTASFNQFVAYRAHNGYPFQLLEQALQGLPLPPPKDLKASYVELLDREVEARTARLTELERRIAETETALQDRMKELEGVSVAAEALQADLQSQREEIASVSQSAESDMRLAWQAALEEWQQERKAKDNEHEAQALESIATLAATTSAGEALAEHAAGDLSATDWYGRAKRERTAAQWIRVGAWIAFVFAGAVGFYIVNEAIIKNFDISIGGGILRASIAVVIGAFGALLLREAGRHFREADTAEDVALSLKALAPFYANSADGIRLAARVELGDAVLVKNVLSRFSHRDASKHGAEVKPAELPGLVKEAAEALKITGDATTK
ncbi:hypothetical protein [Microbacterium sp. W4I20]|uniref:hypothetical protein n=1 Tax=Microbacterium sp. W4I20 TaxID=3042262 RepID=UPI002781759B|nr:hypothetical protein [Microbacterium sp. W4I20]MDQ0729185.1 Skp family chaperone for outer membrane proteins [Microbacterium sp. W4I20]